MFLCLSQKQNSLCRNINHFFRGNFLWLFYQLVIRIHSQQRILFLCLYRTNSFYSRLAIFVLMHCIHSETFQFRCKFFQNLIRQSSPFQHGFVEHGSEFITSHWTIPFEFSIGVTSEHTIAFQSRYIFISPVILRYIWEELELRRIQFLSCIHIQQSRFQTFQFFSEVFDFLRHSYLGSRNMVALAQFQADTCIHHIFTITEAAAYREHGIFIRTIVSADSGCIFAIVIAIACCDIPLVIWIEVQRMERCQSGCTSTDFVDAVAQLTDTLSILHYLLVGCKELAAIDSVSRFFRNIPSSYIGDFLVIGIETLVADIGFITNGQSVLCQGNIFYCDTIGIHLGIPCGNTREIQILIQAHLIVFATVLIGIFADLYVFIISRNGSMFLCYFFYAGDTFIQFSDSFGVFANICRVLSDSFRILLNVFGILSDGFAIVFDIFCILTDSFGVFANICRVLSDSFGVLLNVFCILICFVFDTFELTTIHCIGRSLFHFTSSHTTNFAALINGNPIVDCYSATISHADRR